MPRAKISLFLGAVTLGASLTGISVAHAQPQPTPAPQPAPPAAPTDERVAEGKRQFDAGVALLEDPDGAKYEDGYRAFKKAYELTQSPKVLGNLAFCAYHLERDGEAIDAYTTYLHDVPEIDEKERKQIQRDLTTLTATVARVKIAVKHAGTAFVLLDKREATRGGAVANEYPFDGYEITLRVRPGRHVLKIRAGDEESDPIDVTIEPGSTIVQEAKFTPKAVAGGLDAAQSKPSYAGPIVLGAVGVAGMAAGLLTGILAKSKQHDIRDNCTLPNDFCPASYDYSGNRSSAKTLATVSNVGWIGGGALLAGGVVWGALTARGRSSQNITAKTSWLVGGMCLREGCAMNLQGGF